jgi:Uma2 family endonuclease
VPVSAQTYRQLAVEDPDGQWELHCGSLRQKPLMTVEHNHVMTRLLVWLAQQLNDDEYTVRSDSGRVRASGESYFIPDVLVIPMRLVRPLRRRRDALEAYAEPLPLVVEVWSPSTGDYDVEAKLPEYQRRGDLEIWRGHPYDHTLTSWRRQPDGSYLEGSYTHGAVEPVALPGVAIDLDALFA